MVKTDLTSLPIEVLIELALERKLLEEWERENRWVRLRVGMFEVTLLEPHARAYLRGLIHRHDLSHSETHGF